MSLSYFTEVSRQDHRGMFGFIAGYKWIDSGAPIKEWRYFLAGF